MKTGCLSADSILAYCVALKTICKSSQKGHISVCFRLSDIFLSSLSPILASRQQAKLVHGTFQLTFQCAKNSTPEDQFAPRIMSNPRNVVFFQEVNRQNFSSAFNVKYVESFPI